MHEKGILPGLPGSSKPYRPAQLEAAQHSIDEAKISVESIGDPLRADELGLVLSSPILVWQVHNIGRTGPDSVSFVTMQRTRTDPQELNQALLFWDRLHASEELVKLIDRDPNLSFLVKEGLVRKTDSNAFRYDPRSIEYLDTECTNMIKVEADLSDRMTKVRLALFEHLESLEPGRWTLSSGLNSPHLPSYAMEPGHGLVVQLLKSLPIPDGSVPLHDTLQFRSKRRSELLALRHHLMQIYRNLANDDIRGLVGSQELLSFENSLEAYKRVLAEGKLRSILTSIKANISSYVSNLTVGGFGGALAGDTHIAVVGALGGTLQVFVGDALKSRRDTKNPFQYISDYHKELPWQPNDSS